MKPAAGDSQMSADLPDTLRHSKRQAVDDGRELIVLPPLRTPSRGRWSTYLMGSGSGVLNRTWVDKMPNGKSSATAATRRVDCN